MKDTHSYGGHRIDLFPQSQKDGTWSCYLKIDGEWMNKEESGIIHGASGANKVDAQKKALDDAKLLIESIMILKGN